MKKLITAICVALFALSGTAVYAADYPATEKKAEPAKPATAKAGDKAASAASAPAAAAASAPAKKKEKKGGC